MKWLKRLGLLLLALLALYGLMFLWSLLAYGPHQIIHHNRIVITLPYSTANEATHIIPMGETIAHPFKGGHPGIDFQWDHSVPLIAVADGKITSVAKADDMGEPVLYVTLRMGDYTATYKELEKMADGVQKGSELKQGDVVGYPHCVVFADNGGHTSCQVHWEFAYASIVPTITNQINRLCPVTYFDANARTRIEFLWASIPADEQFKKNFPNICSNIYVNHDQ